ncbi:hypothetical protein MBANPS3_012391 [Mucor bainieri]
MDRCTSISFLKKYYMHSIQSMHRVSNNHALEPLAQLADFQRLIIMEQFPNLESWLKWWLQRQVRSMNFACSTYMKRDLQDHGFRTTNTVQDYHSVIYTMLEKRPPLYDALTLLLQISRRDGDLLVNNEKHQVQNRYGRKHKKSPAKSKKMKWAAYSDVNDGRAPANNATIFPKESSSTKCKAPKDVLVDEEGNECEPRGSQPKKSKKDEEASSQLEAMAEDCASQTQFTPLVIAQTEQTERQWLDALSAEAAKKEEEKKDDDDEEDEEDDEQQLAIDHEMGNGILSESLDDNIARALYYKISFN